MIGAHDLDTLQAQLEAAPDTRRKRQALGCLRLSRNAHALTSDPEAAERLRRAYFELARAKLEAGLEERLETAVPPFDAANPFSASHPAQKDLRPSQRKPDLMFSRNHSQGLGAKPRLGGKPCL